MNRTIKEAAVSRYHDDARAQIEQHLTDVVAADNFARRHTIRKGLMSYQFICKQRRAEAKRFIANSLKQMPGLQT